MMTPEQYNRLRGRALGTMLMPLIKAAADAREELTMRQLTIRLADQESLHDKDQRDQLYYRVRQTLRQLQDAGLVKVTTEFHKTMRVNVNLITLP
jgi:hypothetical protein